MATGPGHSCSPQKGCVAPSSRQSKSHVSHGKFQGKNYVTIFSHVSRTQDALYEKCPSLETKQKKGGIREPTTCGTFFPFLSFLLTSLVFEVFSPRRSRLVAGLTVSSPRLAIYGIPIVSETSFLERGVGSVSLLLLQGEKKWRQNISNLLLVRCSKVPAPLPVPVP